MISAVLGFAVVAGLMTLIPGIDTALVLRSSITGGPRTAYATVTGICLGLLAWGIAAAVGISAILTASQLAYDIIRVAGACYMVALGIRLIWQARRAAPPAPEADMPPSDDPGLWSSFVRGFLTNLLNPKIGVFYMAVLPQFIPSDAPALAAGTLLSLTHAVEALVWFSALILGTRLLRPWLGRASVQAWIDRITGAVLIGFGLKVALERH